MKSDEKNPAAFEWGFAGLFVLYVGMFVGLAEAGSEYMLVFRELTASAITAVWGLFSVPVVCSGTGIQFAGFPMEIVLECTALHYMMIFVAGVMAFRSHTRAYRAAGIIIGTLAIFLLNIARIGIIGFIGKYFSNIFEMVHDYLWQGLFALAVVLLWVVWVNGIRGLSRRFVRQFLIVSVSASVSFWLGVIFLEEYISLLAVLSGVMFSILSVWIDVPQQVITDGSVIGYVVGETVIYSRTTLYVLNAALLLPIASITFVRQETRLFFKRLSVAAVLFIAQHMLIVLLDWLLEIMKGAEIQSVLTWGIVMSSFIAPMLIWLAAMTIFRATIVFPSSESPDR